ncbi:MAG TPA: type II toxin-antitoxin system VapC family toxin [Thermomicrobiales bacterium]|nr:type II toxin-antitoxin system VapC family toxin [Thermomicrobiales bacterium]
MARLIDTDIVIYHLNDVQPATQLVDRLFDEGIAISAITLMEVLDGLEQARDARSAQLRFDVFAGRVPVIPFVRVEAVIAASVRRALRQQGRRVRPRALDLQIAATALTNDLTLVTNNPSDYQDIRDLRLQHAGIAV